MPESLLGRGLTILIAHASAYLTDFEPRGDGLAAFEFISRLAARGHRLHVIVERATLQAELPPSVTVHRLRPRRRGSKLERLRLAREISSTVADLRRECAFDLIHQLNPVDLALSSGIDLGDTPLILGPYWPRWPAQSPRWRLRPQHVLALLEKPLRWHEQRRAAAVLLSTPSARQRVVVAGRHRPHIHLLSPGIDESFLSIGRDNHGHSQRVLFLSNLEPEKGIMTLLSAFDLVAKALPEATLTIAGSGSMLGAVERQVAASPARDRITSLGNVSRNQIPQLLASSDVFCQPSRGEPFGISALEAMAAGLPVIGTDAGGLRHLLGLDPRVLVPVDDARALASRVADVLADERLARDLGNANRALVRSRYTWERIIDRLERIYGEALSHSP